MSYRKVGGLHFVKLGRFGFSFYWSKRERVQREPLSPEVYDAMMSALYPFA